MKKIYLLGLSVLLVGGATAQNMKKKNTVGKPLFTHASANKLVQTPNQVQTTYWSDDFSTAANWTIDEGAGSSGSALWVIGTTPASGTYSGSYGEIMSTTAANGYALFDSDSDCSGEQIAQLTTTNAIDLSASGAAVRLVFQEHYLRWYDSTLVYVSNDGGTNWTAFPLAINNNTDIEGGPTTIGANPTTVAVDISSVAAMQANVKIRFTFYSTSAAYGSTNAGCGYMWYIDDAKIEDIPSIDASIVNETLPDGDCGLGAAEQVSIDIMNGGLAPITGFDVQYIVNGGTPVVETYTGSIASGATASYTFTTTVNMSAAGTYTVDTHVALTGDGDNSNDDQSASTDHFPMVNIPYATSFEDAPASDLENWRVYNVDGTTSGWSLDNNYPNSGSNELLIIENDGTNPVAGLSDQWAISSCLNLMTGNTYRVKYWAQLPSASFNCGIQIGLSSTQDVAGMTTTIKPLTVPSPAGAYVQDSADFTVSTSGTYYMGFRGQNTNATAMAAIMLDDIEIIIAPPIGIKENANSNTIAIFPNPSNGVFTVKAVENNSSVAVYSVIGENVYNANLAKGNNAVDLSNLAAGTYIVKVKSGNETTTKRVVINK